MISWQWIRKWLCTLRGKHSWMERDNMARRYCRICGIQEGIIQPPATPTDPTPTPGGDSGSTGRWVAARGDMVNPQGWAQTVTIANARISGGVVAWDVTAGADRRMAWARTGKIDKDPNGVLGFLVVRDGVTYYCCGEWLLPGQASQDSRKPFLSDRTHEGKDKNFFDRKYQPVNGETIHLVVSGLNWKSQKNVQERSNPTPLVVSGMPDARHESAVVADAPKDEPVKRSDSETPEEREQRRAERKERKGK